MYIRSIGLGLLAILLAGGGCGKPASGGASESAGAKRTAQTAPPPVETVARLHWLGLKRLATDTNAAYFLSLWNLPETAALANQTLDKLALSLESPKPEVQSPKSKVQSPEQAAPDTPPSPLVPHPSTPDTRPSPPDTRHSPPDTRHSALRPLLDDLVQEESWLEIRNATNLPGELALAVRLSEPRASLWGTSLAAALQSLTGTVPSPITNGWQVPVTTAGAHAARYLSFARAGEWTLLTLTLSPPTNSLPPIASSLLSTIHSQLSTNNAWLEADFNPPRVASALACGWKLPDDLPRISLTATGDGESVRSRGELDFPQALPGELDAWNIPTNLIHEPLVSFTAVRGIKPWLDSLNAWTNLNWGDPPNQLFGWSQDGPFEVFCAAPLLDASNTVFRLTEKLLTQANPWLATNATGQFERSTNSNGVVWQDFPIVTPFLESAGNDTNGFVTAGLVPNNQTNRHAPVALLQQIYSQTNLVHYDWEMTGPRIEQLLYSGQLMRLALHFAQVPPKGPGVLWLRALEYKLGNCGTTVSRTGPAQLAFVRKSNCGLTAAELHLLVDWLESPEFPRGLHTLLGKPDPLPNMKPHGAGKGHTNAPLINTPLQRGGQVPGR